MIAARVRHTTVVLPFRSTTTSGRLMLGLSARSVTGPHLASVWARGSAIAVPLLTTSAAVATAAPTPFMVRVRALMTFSRRCAAPDLQFPPTGRPSARAEMTSSTQVEEVQVPVLPQIFPSFHLQTLYQPAPLSVQAPDH